MLIKISMSLRKDKPSHIILPKFLELIKDDKVMKNTTKALLEGLKKNHQNYVPIPLGHDVIIDSTRFITLHRDTKPEAKVWTREDWTDSDKFDFTVNSQNFVNKILKTYETMGYDNVITESSHDEVTRILIDLDKLMAKTKKRLERLGF